MDISWKFRLTFWQGNYIWSLSLWIWTQMRQLGALIPRFCTEFRYLLYGQSGLAWGAFFWKTYKISRKSHFSKMGMCKNQEMLIRRYAIFVFNLLLHNLNRIAWVNIQSNCLTGQSLDKYLIRHSHTTLALSCIEWYKGLKDVQRTTKNLKELERDQTTWIEEKKQK